MNARRPCAVLLSLFAAALPAAAQWIQYVDESGGRLVAEPDVGLGDVAEKDFAWGDVDNDGDVDLVVVRKQPFTTAGKRTNVLFVNEDGVLVDRTAIYATDSDVPGDEGFLTPTNDRDVVLVDVDNDGFLDIVTAVTISDGDPKHIGHPRVYRNLGRLGPTGPWLGFRHEDFRIPAMASYSGLPGFNPRFCSVAAADVNGDGFADLWFGDYDSGAGGTAQPPGADYNDRLLINDGQGEFKDRTTQYVTATVFPSSPLPFQVSAFGAAAEIVDMNGDGAPDIVKQTALNAPQYVGIAYNTAGAPGAFADAEVVYQFAPYHISVGDLNNDAKPDIVVSDDGLDRYLLNLGNGPDGRADFESHRFEFDRAADDGFASNSLIVDLDQDGWNDVLIADVDVDSPGCGRRMHVFRNLGGTPGGVVSLEEQSWGEFCTGADATYSANCIVGGLPGDKLRGVHDVAAFDVDGDGWLDLVVGRCASTEVYLGSQPVGLRFLYPQGLPNSLTSGASTTFQVEVVGIGATEHVPESVRFHLRIGGGAFVEETPVDLGGGLYEVQIPPVPCTESAQFYFTAEATGGQGTFADPPSAPDSFYSAISYLGALVLLEEGFETGAEGWTVVSDPSLTGGAWERAQPVGSVTNLGAQAAPSEDAQALSDQVMAFVTQNGQPFGSAEGWDVDGGPTDLFSPPLDLEGTDGLVSYSRWFFTSGSDRLEVAVSSDGTSWVDVESVATNAGAWVVSSFRVGDYVVPSSNVRVRFRVADVPNNSVTEAGIDLFRLEAFLCQPCEVAAECDDGQHCTGIETCVDGACVPGADPCPGEQCDEPGEQCLGCIVDAHCDDGLWCNGSESCVDNECAAGIDPCPGTQCDEALDLCVECLDAAVCQDGNFCNGAEVCAGGFCAGGIEACPGRDCDEVAEECIGTTELQPRMGMPLLRLTQGQLARFEAGRQAFNRTLVPGEGLGPTFNQNSCASCHNNPVGGSGSIAVTRFGAGDEKGGGFDPLTPLGGSLLQAQALVPECQEVVPPEANVTANRQTSSTLGAGLVEAVPDDALRANALAPPPGVSGRAIEVPLLEAAGQTRVGRFGWKSQVATVLSFSADAALNEMGLTNRLLPDENAPNGNVAALALCDGVADPEDAPDAQGKEFIDRVTDFQRFLAPPPRTPRSGMTGEVYFGIAGCAKCHVGFFETVDDESVEPELRARRFHPYSDFLVHDMGLAADFVAQGDAGPREIRTAPLWGLRARDPLWHDGRFSGGSFDERVLAAIGAHDAPGSEAAISAQSFFGLPASLRQAVLRFLGSLGRAEFDLDGDQDVDLDDWVSFLGCFTGPGGSYTPEVPCAVADPDQDGDVDDDDYRLLLLALPGGPAGSVPDGATVPGTPLALARGPGGALELTWGPSCAAGDSDYAVFEGTLGDWTSHVPAACSTGGATSWTLTPAPGNSYYLVVPLDGDREGGYGADSEGEPRYKPFPGCLPGGFGACD